MLLLFCFVLQVLALPTVTAPIRAIGAESPTMVTNLLYSPRNGPGNMLQLHPQVRPEIALPKMNANSAFLGIERAQSGPILTGTYSSKAPTTAVLTPVHTAMDHVPAPNWGGLSRSSSQSSTGLSTHLTAGGPDVPTTTSLNPAMNHADVATPLWDGLSRSSSGYLQNAYRKPAVQYARREKQSMKGRLLDYIQDKAERFRYRNIFRIYNPEQRERRI